MVEARLTDVGRDDPELGMRRIADDLLHLILQGGC